MIYPSEGLGPYIGAPAKQKQKEKLDFSAEKCLGPKKCFQNNRFRWTLALSHFSYLKAEDSGSGSEQTPLS